MRPLPLRLPPSLGGAGGGEVGAHPSECFPASFSAASSFKLAHRIGHRVVDRGGSECVLGETILCKLLHDAGYPLGHQKGCDFKALLSCTASSRGALTLRILRKVAKRRNAF